MNFLKHAGLRPVMFADFFLVNIVMYGGLIIRFGLEWPSPPNSFALSFSVASIIFLATHYFGGFYDDAPRLGRVPVFPRALALSLISGGFVSLVTLSSSGLFEEFSNFGIQRLPFPFVNLVVTIAVFPLLATFTRSFVNYLVDRRRGKPRIVVCGAPVDADSFQADLQRDGEGCEIVAVVTDRKNLARQIQEFEPAAVVFLSPAWITDGLDNLLDQLVEQKVSVFVRITGLEVMYGLSTIRNLFGLPFVALRSSVLPRSRSQLKRLLDLVLLVITSPLWSWVLALIALYQLFTAGRPIFYLQNRVGLDGRVFPMIKFRTMILDAESKTGPILSTSGDDRIIPGGRWLRATRLDELPQLINVLRGDMSLVGPRPERPEMTEGLAREIPSYDRRHAIRPGLTGLAQTQGRYSTRAEYKLGYDLHYASNWTPVMDLTILLRTIWVVLARRV